MKTHAFWMARFGLATSTGYPLHRGLDEKRKIFGQLSARASAVPSGVPPIINFIFSSLPQLEDIRKESNDRLRRKTDADLRKGARSAGAFP